MQHTAVITAGGCFWVSGHLQGQRWAGTVTGRSFEGVGVERQPKGFFVFNRAAVVLLIHPSVLDWRRRMRKLVPFPWAAFQCKLRSNWRFQLLMALPLLTQASTCPRAAFLSELKQKNCLHSSNVSKPLRSLAEEVTLSSGHLSNR